MTTSVEDFGVIAMLVASLDETNQEWNVVVAVAVQQEVAEETVAGVVAACHTLRQDQTDAFGIA